MSLGESHVASASLVQGAHCAVHEGDLNGHPFLPAGEKENCSYKSNRPTRFAVAQVKLRNRTFSGTKNARSLSHTRSCNKVAGPIRSRKNWEMSIQETDL